MFRHDDIIIFLGAKLSKLIGPFTRQIQKGFNPRTCVFKLPRQNFDNGQIALGKYTNVKMQVKNALE